MVSPARALPGVRVVVRRPCLDCGGVLVGAAS